MATRTGPHRSEISSRYSGETSLSSLRTLRLITRNSTSTGRTFSTSSSQRDVIHAHGQEGSKYIVTVVRSLTGSPSDRVDNRFHTLQTLLGTDVFRSPSAS